MVTRVRDVMVPARWTVPAGVPLQDAARLMRSWDARDVFVVDEGHFRGILNDVDIVVVAIASGRSPTAMTAGDCVTANAPRLEADEPVTDALVVMQHHQLKRAPVVDGGLLVGAVWIADLEDAVRRATSAPTDRKAAPASRTRRRLQRRERSPAPPADIRPDTRPEGREPPVPGVSAPLFEVARRTGPAGGSGAAVVLALTGELDLSTVPIFLDALDEVLTTTANVGSLTVDARGLTFADSSAIYALLRARNAVDEHGASFQLTNVAGSFERTLALTGMDAAFEIIVP
jgi:anti-anti-sigma factor